MKVRASGSKYSFRAEVGPVKDDGQFVFGHTAEVHVGASYGSDVPVAEVSFAAIGSHSPEVARDRVAAYTAAISIAERINEQIADGFTDLEALAQDLDGRDA
jgi:hypothetical protein